MFHAGKGDVFLGLLAPARAAGVDRGVPRRRGGHAAGLVGGVARVTGRAGRCSPNRAAPSSPSRSAWSPCCCVSGLIEALVTPSPLPTFVRIAIGVAAEVAFLGYVVHFGRKAVRAGETGDVDDAPDVVPTALTGPLRACRWPSSPGSGRPARAPAPRARRRPRRRRAGAAAWRSTPRSLRDRSAAAASYTCAASDRPAASRSTRGSATAAISTWCLADSCGSTAISPSSRADAFRSVSSTTSARCRMRRRTVATIAAASDSTSAG